MLLQYIFNSLVVLVRIVIMLIDLIINNDNDNHAEVRPPSCRRKGPLEFGSRALPAVNNNNNNNDDNNNNNDNRNSNTNSTNSSNHNKQ